MFSYEHDQTLQTGAGLFDRRAHGRIQLTGGDRRSYLHGLLTNDILALSAGQGCYAALLTPNGRMVSDMRVSELGDRILIDLPAERAGAVRQRLEDFVFSEDVQVHDVADTMAHLAVYGPAAAEVVARAAGWSAEAGGAGLDGLRPDANRELRVAGHPAVIVGSDDFGAPGYEIFCAAGAFEAIERGLVAAGAASVSRAALEITRVEAGRPLYGLDMDESTIPLEAGIEDRAISLTKGCYVGQEIIIRVLHRAQGRVARHLVGLLAPADAEPLERGTRLFAGSREVGAVTSAVFSPRLRRPIALGYAHRDAAEPGTVVQAGAPEGISLIVATVPFAPPAGG